MKAEYDKETDTLTITLRDARVKESDEIRPGVIADFGYDGGVVGFEVLQASKVVEKAGKCSSQSLITDYQQSVAVSRPISFHTNSVFPTRQAVQRLQFASYKQKEPHDETHHAALKMASISYTRPSVASVGSSIADVIANPLSAW